MAKSNELEKLMNDHLQNLTDQAKLYDAGDDEAAIQMAFSARAIFQEREQSGSLFSQLGLQNLLFLLSTTTQYIPGQPKPYYGLLDRKCLEGELPGQGTGELTPISQLDSEFVNKWHSFGDWWQELVANGDGYSLSRRDVVLMIANPAAGVDGDRDASHTSPAYDDSSGWIYPGPGGKSIFEKKHAYASMRQIAYEILKSFEYHSKIKSYTRKVQTKLNAIYFNDKLYFASYECEKYPITAAALVDPRKERIETREVCFDSLNFKDGSRNGRILAI